MMPSCITLGSNSNSSTSSVSGPQRRSGWRIVMALTVAALAALAIGRSATLGRSFDAVPVVLSAERQEESVLLDLLLLRNQHKNSQQRAVTPYRPATAEGAHAERVSSAIVAAKAAGEEKTTLALLYPPGLQGGYRNQVLRMVALCQYALLHNRTLFLPSVWWSTQRETRRKNDADPHSTNATEPSTEQYVWYPVPMDLIFDVDHWNRMARQHPESLPLLVDNLPPRNEKANRSGDCWSTEEPQRQQQSTTGFDYLQRELEMRGHLLPVGNWTQKLLQWPPAMDVLEYNPRRNDLLPLVEHCTRPYVHGGGKMAGRLWNEYLGLAHEASTKAKTNTTNEGVYESVLRALRPRAEWRKVGIDHCLMSQSSSPSNGSRTDYVAVHARIEPEMMAHPCGRNMERNLAVILDHVAHLLKNQSFPSTTSIVVAVSREGLIDPRFPQFMELSQANLQILNEYTGGTVDESHKDRQPRKKPKLLHGQFPIVECGGEMMARYYRSLQSGSINDRIVDDDNTYGTLLEQVINFDLAVQAKVFVGVQWSSYSNAIWTTRFLLDKGANYRYTKTGIEPVIGMPPPHSNCPRGSAAAERGNRKRPQ